MSKIKSLFRKALAPVVDPERNARVAVIVAAIGAQLQVRRSGFDLDKLIRTMDCTATDVQVATKAYYNRLSLKYWKNGIPDEKQKRMLALVAEKLRFRSNEVAKWNEYIAATYFGACLADVLADGVVTDTELEKLSQISSFSDQPVRTFLRQHMYEEGVGFLRGVFAEAATTGVLDPRLWANLVQSAQQIGFTSQELTSAISPLAQSFAEHVLADTKADGHLSGSEEGYLSWLLRSFEFGPEFDAYVREEMAKLRDKTLNASGNLTAIAIPKGIHLQAGEIPYFLQQSTLRCEPQLKSVSRSEEYAGYLLLTDNRLLFRSKTKQVNISYRSIVVWNATAARIEVSIANKPPMNFSFSGGQMFSPQRFDPLIRMHSQALQRRLDGAPDRHIPLDMRRRVWQRLGGKCAECGAAEYLEFDHIVPVAKGGGNSDQNVQILCRRCNSNLSDKI